MKLRLPTFMPFLLSLWLAPMLAFAGVEQISEKEFRALAEELAPKVNLFAAGWEKDPKAEFYGGTTRDYLYWLKGQFVETRNREDAEAVIKKLHALPLIDVRSFIIGDSDVDVISAGTHSLDAAEFGVRKIDFQKTEILDPTTELGQNEMLQGYIPAEKVRLGKDGLKPSNLGDGLHEIYTGKLSVHFTSAEDFAKSKYAKEGINHPILLALRYIRVQAINYFRTHGKGFPKSELLAGGIDPQSARQVKELIERVVKTAELKPYLEKKQFHSWINGAIQKSFRSYTNPTAALELMKRFGVTELPSYYPGQIEPLNQYVFSQYRDSTQIENALKNNQVDQAKFFTPASEFFPDGNLYHGTRTEEAFRGILFQGILPSEIGAAQGGLYGVAETDKTFSENWGGDKNRLLSFNVDPAAKIVDVTQGEGKRVFESTAKIHEGNHTKFANLFGVDIVRYPHTPQAFVVKNAAVLSAPQGVYRKVMPLVELIEEAKRVKNPGELLDLLSVNSPSQKETKLVIESSPFKIGDFAPLVEDVSPHPFLIDFLRYNFVIENPGIQSAMAKSIGRNSLALNALQMASGISRSFYAWIDTLFHLPQVSGNRDIGLILLRRLKDIPEHWPNAVGFALSNIRGGSKEAQMSSALVEYLSSVPLEKSDLDRASALLSADLMPGNVDINIADILLKQGSHQEKTLAYLRGQMSEARSVGGVDFNIAEKLLQNGGYQKEVKSYLMSQVHSGDTARRQGEALKILSPHFSDDPEVTASMLEFTKKYFSIVDTDQKSMPNSSLIKGFAATWPENEELKAFLLNKLYISSLTEPKKAVDILVKMNLKPDDLVKIVRMNPNRDAINRFLEIFNHTEGQHLWVTDAKFTRALLETSLNYLKPEFHNFHVHQILKKHGDPATIKGFFLEKLRNPEQLSPARMRKMIGTMSSLHFEKPMSPELANVLLPYLKAHHPELIADQLFMFPLEDQGIALQIQEFLRTENIPINNEHVGHIQRMSGITDEFRHYLTASPHLVNEKKFEEFKRIQLNFPSCAAFYAKISP